MLISAVAAQEAATDALRAALDPAASQLLEALLDAVTDRYVAGQMHLIAELEAAFPGFAPAIRTIGDLAAHPPV